MDYFSSQRMLVLESKRGVVIPRDLK